MIALSRQYESVNLSFSVHITSSRVSMCLVLDLAQQRVMMAAWQPAVVYQLLLFQAEVARITVDKPVGKSVTG